MKEIELTKGLKTLVDDDDFEKLSKFKWHSSHGYAVRDDWSTGKRIHVRMHRIIVNCPDGYEVDHINNNPLDNRKDNLRICLKTENNKNLKLPNTNKTGYKGVSFSKERKKYCAYISVGNKTKGLGRFNTAIEAANAYNKAAIFYYGEFANINKGIDDN